jgi:hypothetical protein
VGHSGGWRGSSAELIAQVATSFIRCFCIDVLIIEVGSASALGATPPSLKKTPGILPRLSYPASWVLAHAPIVATNIMANTSAAPNRQAKAAGMMVFIIGTPVHGYDAIKLIAGRQLCSD